MRASWHTSRTGKSISIQDYKYTDRAFSLSAPLPGGKKTVDELPVTFFTDVLFDLNVRYHAGKMPFRGGGRGEGAEDVCFVGGRGGGRGAGL